MISAETYETRGVLLLNAVTLHNSIIVGKAPSLCGFTSRRMSQQLTASTRRALFVMAEIKGKQCSTCGEMKPLSEFHKSKKERDGHRSRCKDCRKIKEPYSAVKEYQDKYRETNRTRIQTYFHSYNAKRASRQAEYYTSWKEANKETWEAYQKEYYQQNADKKRKYASQYAKDNPEVARSTWHRRRGRKLGRGVFTRQEWEALKVKYNYTCLCCGKREPEIKLTPDHVIPLSRGGMNTIDNIQPLCRRCNNIKSARIKDYRG